MMQEGADGNSFLPNSRIAELLALAAEKAKMPLQKALRRASRKAFLWADEASMLADLSSLFYQRRFIDAARRKVQ